MTTHSLQVGQGAAAVVAHRLVPLPDRGGGSLQQGANAHPVLPVSFIPTEDDALTLSHFLFADSTRCCTVAPTVPSGGYLRGSDPVEVRLLTSLSNPCCAHPKRFFNHTLRRVGP